MGPYRPDVIIPFGVLSMLVQGWVLGGLYPRLVSRPGSFAGAMRLVAVAALFSWSFTTLAVAANHPMTSVPRYVLIETAFTVVQFLLVGPLLAASSRRFVGPRTATGVGSPT